MRTALRSANRRIQSVRTQANSCLIVSTAARPSPGTDRSTPAAPTAVPSTAPALAELERALDVFRTVNRTAKDVVSDSHLQQLEWVASELALALPLGLTETASGSLADLLTSDAVHAYLLLGRRQPATLPFTECESPSGKGRLIVMAHRTRRSAGPVKPLLKTPVRIGSLDAAALVGELRQLHEEAEDKDVERMPADGELFQALLYLESHKGALKNPEARRVAGIKRVQLWEYLREQVDLHQAQAIEDARAANATWADLVPALAVNAASAAYNKAKRLRAAVLSTASHGDRPVRRTPEAVVEVERQIAAQAAAERRAEEEARRRHELVFPVAQRLLEHRAGLTEDEDVIYWLNEVAEVLPRCETPTQKVSLRTYVQAVVRELRKSESRTGRPVATTEEARLAYAAAADLFPR
ncbi:hypothetical protein [Streptomyces sp. NPDC002133]|uniref:hypothetical protein n=1 Tax=Streptomyces sp. NPDC002133 TaxID=3154409 RepID=UPI003324CAFC